MDGREPVNLDVGLVFGCVFFVSRYSCLLQVNSGAVLSAQGFQIGVLTLDSIFSAFMSVLGFIIASFKDGLFSSSDVRGQSWWFRAKGSGSLTALVLIFLIPLIAGSSSLVILNIDLP